jgi:transposase
MSDRPWGLPSRPDNAATGRQGRELIATLGCPRDGCALVMDRAYEGNETRGLASLLGFRPVVPPNPLRRTPWRFNRRLYRQRNQIERRFRRLKGFHRVFTRYDKLDTLFRGFVLFALCWISVSTP